MWLESPVVEGGESSGEPEKWSRAGKGTPQGEVISPLASNLYRHWFDKVFRRSKGSESGLSGLHVPLSRRSARTRMALSERVAVGKGSEEGAGEAEGDDWPEPVFPAAPETD